MLPYNTAVLSYDEVRFPFRQFVTQYLGDVATWRDDAIGRLAAGKERTPFHQQLYQIGEPFLDLYRRFVRDEVLVGDFSSAYLYQAIPSWRVHLPGNVATGTFHKDSDFNHPFEEINFLVPLTPMHDTASVWLESEPGALDFCPVDLEPGQYLRFHGACLMHGSVPNTTGRARVSFDFRLLPRTAYQDRGLQTVNAGMDLRLGAYYADGGVL